MMWPRSSLEPMFATEPPLERPAAKADIEVRYVRGDRFLVQVRDHHLVVDQPTEAGGDDVGPTPTELFVAGLASCVGFYAERFLLRHRLSAEGLRVECDFDVTTSRPARVESVDLRLTLPEDFPPERRAALLAVVEHCTVHNSLRVTPQVRVSIRESEFVAA